MNEEARALVREGIEGRVCKEKEVADLEQSHE